MKCASDTCIVLPKDRMLLCNITLQGNSIYSGTSFHMHKEYKNYNTLPVIEVKLLIPKAVCSFGIHWFQSPSPIHQSTRCARLSVQSLCVGELSGISERYCTAFMLTSYQRRTWWKEFNTGDECAIGLKIQNLLTNSHFYLAIVSFGRSATQSYFHGVLCRE